MKRAAPLLRKTRLRPMSIKRQQERVEYLEKRAAFLARHPRCQAWAKIITAHPEAPLPIHCPHSREIHHRAGRLNGAYLDETTWLAVCRLSHNWIHQHPKEARNLGLLT